MSVATNEKKTVARTSPSPKMVTQVFWRAVFMASSSVFPFRASSLILVTKKMS